MNKHKLVPIEPTHEMFEQGLVAWRCREVGMGINEIYSAMVAAAPSRNTQIERLEKVNEALVRALEEISKGEGAFSQDPLTHAGNVIENMMGIARAALAKEPA